MSRGGSRISSSLFSQPVVKPNKPSVVVAKGPGDYVHVGGNGDDYEVKDASGTPFTFSRQHLREALAALKPSAGVAINALTVDLKKIFDDVSSTMATLYQTPAYYELVTADVRTAFAEIREPRVGTVGAYFMGCFTIDKGFTGPMTCSPKCAASLMPSPGTPGFGGACDDRVLTYLDNKLAALNDKKANLAYIYVDNTFKAFTPLAIEQLTAAGIQTAILLVNNEGATVMRDPMPIANLPKQAPTIDNANQAGSNASTSGGVNGWAIFWAIVIIAIIIIIIVLLVRAAGGYSAMAARWGWN